MTVVVGIDPSLTVSGCACVQWEPGDSPAPVWQTWRGRAPKPDVSTVEMSRRRIRVMLREILALVPARVDLSVVEGPSFGSRTALSLADERAGLRWMLIDQLLARGPVAVVSPATRSLLATGSGRSSKTDVLAAVRSDFPGAHVPDHNVADAVVLAASGAFTLGMPWGMTERQSAAHARVAWPVEIAAA